MSNLHALLIGVDYYAPHELPGGIYYPPLGGCVRDVLHVESYLLDHLGISQDRIMKLLATNAGGAAAVEPASQQPTYANIILAMRELRDRAKAGDQVYVHYSGHGGRARTIFQEVKGNTGFDEALVPTDIGTPTSRYLRDIEIAYLIRELLEKEVYLTVVFDSCHSGGATRGVSEKRAIARGISDPDTAEHEIDSLVAPMEVLIDSWKRQPRPAANRSATERAASGWLLEPSGYTFLAACRASESALEYPFTGLESNGALTYWLLDTLRNAKSGWSYKVLHDRILAKVHGQFVTQTPQLQGEGSREIFASRYIPSIHTVPVHQVNAGQVQLNAGEVQGIQRDDTFAIYPHGTTAEEFGSPAHQIAEATVEQVDAASVWARVKPTNEISPQEVQVGDQAVLLQSTRLQRTVGLFDIKDTDAAQRLLQAVEVHGAGFIKVLDNENVDFQVTVNEQGEWEICDPAGVPLPHIRPALGVDEISAPEKVVKRLVHLCKYNSILALSAPDGEIRQQLHMELLGGNEPDTETPLLHPSALVKLRVQNLQQPGEKDDPERILNVCVLLLHSDWSVTQIYPESSANFFSLDPSGTPLELDFEAYLPEGVTETRDVFKVFASREQTSFRWLELPSLDQPNKSRAVAKSATTTDPLEQMFAAMTDGTTTKRSVRLVGIKGENRWTLAQVELWVKEAEMVSAI